MADYQSLINAPEYAKVIEQLTQQYALQKKQADAQAIGEAQRRGLVNQTGTSDIEASLRGNAVAPIAQAEGGAISNVLNQAAQAGNQNQQAGLQREWGTSERVGSQGWQTGENTANRTWEEAMANKQRQWQLDDAKKEKKNKWKNIASTAVGAGIGGVVGGPMGAYVGSNIGNSLF